MATDFIMPRLPDQQAGFFQPPHVAPVQTTAPPPLLPAGFPSQHYNPNMSPLSTSNNASPTSPRSYHGRSVRPMYMPAVLRPTEFPSKAQPPKPKPRPDTADDDSDRPIRSSGSFISLPGLGAFGRLSRRSTGESFSSADGILNLDSFPRPTAQPTRRHWKPDSQSTICDDPACKRSFSYFTRRHHCRKCGNIFCDAHSTFEVPLDQDANYNPRGSPSRACGHCYLQFKAWRGRANSMASSSAASVQDGAGASNGVKDPACAATTTAYTTTASSSPISTSPQSIGGSITAPQPGAPTPAPQPDAAMSVPRDWNWSTF